MPLARATVGLISASSPNSILAGMAHHRPVWCCTACLPVCVASKNTAQAASNLSVLHGRSKLPQGQCTSRRSLHILLAVKSSNAGENKQPSPSTNSTLAALDLLLGAVQQQQQQPCTQRAEAASTQHPATCLDGAVSSQQTTVGASTTLSPEAIWSEAWGFLEACQPSVPTVRCVTPQTLPKGSRFQRFRPFSSKQHKDNHMLNGKQQRRQGIQQHQPRQRGVSKSPVKQAQLHLQGLETKARLQLLALSLAALERQIAAFSSARIRYVFT